MMDLNDRLKSLEQELKQNEAGIATANQSLQDAQNKVKRLTAQKIALQKALDEIKSGQTAIKSQREAALKELQEAEKTRTDSLAQLGKELSEEQRRGIEAAIKVVDEGIDTQQQKVTALRQQVTELEQVAVAASTQAADLEVQFGQTQTQLRQLPGYIQSAQGQVAKLKAAVKAAVEGGRAREAFFLVKELEQVIDVLKNLADPAKTEATLVNDLANQWQVLRQAKDEAAHKTAAVDQPKQALATAEQELQTKIQGRQAAIKAKLTAGPAVSAPASAPGSGQ